MRKRFKFLNELKKRSKFKTWLKGISACSVEFVYFVYKTFLCFFLDNQSPKCVKKFLIQPLRATLLLENEN